MKIKIYLYDKMQKVIHSIKTFFGLIPLKKRMQDLIQKYNSDTFDEYRYHIVTVKSREILKYINSDFSSNVKRMDAIFVKVAKESYDKFGAVLVYTFNNEINFVFDNENSYYKGNINKTLTSIVSYVTNRVTKELFNAGINMEIMFTGKFVEFEKDFETFNYLVWRQCECYRNNILALAKENGIDTHQVTTKTLLASLNQVDHFVLNGSTIKKELIYVENDISDLITRSFFNVDYVIFRDSFSSNIRKYLYNKTL
jgi:hypothetical protein